MRDLIEEFSQISVAYAVGWISCENNEPYPYVDDIYNDEKLFRSYQHGWRSCDLQKKVKRDYVI